MWEYLRHAYRVEELPEYRDFDVFLKAMGVTQNGPHSSQTSRSLSANYKPSIMVSDDPSLEHYLYKSNVTFINPELYGADGAEAIQNYHYQYIDDFAGGRRLNLIDHLSRQKVGVRGGNRSHKYIRQTKNIADEGHEFSSINIVEVFSHDTSRMRYNAMPSSKSISEAVSSTLRIPVQMHAAIPYRNIVPAGEVIASRNTARNAWSTKSKAGIRSINSDIPDGVIMRGSRLAISGAEFASDLFPL